MTDPTRPTTVAEQEESSQMDRTEQEIQDLRDEVQRLLASLEESRMLHRDAADALSTAERHAAQLVELNMAWEAKATAAIEQRDAALHDLQRSREAHAACVQMLTEQYTAWAQAHEQLKAERDAAVAELERLRTANERLKEEFSAELARRRSLAEQMRAECSLLTKALRPFAAMAEEIDSSPSSSPLRDSCPIVVKPDYFGGKPKATLGDLRAAKAALTPCKMAKLDSLASSCPHCGWHGEHAEDCQTAQENPPISIDLDALTPRDPAAQGVGPLPAVAAAFQCDACGGSGYAVNCTPADRARGDLWACSQCAGTGEDPSRAGIEPGPAPDSPALPVTRDRNSGYETNEWKLRDATGRELPIWIGGRELADLVVAALNASTPATEAGKPTDGERLDWLEANWMDALTRDDTFVESDGRSLRDLIDYHRARAQREREGGGNG